MTEDALTVDDIVNDIVEGIVGAVIVAAVIGSAMRGSAVIGCRPFRLYDWCFRHISYMRVRAERRNIIAMSSHSRTSHRIIIPGMKSIRRPRKPR